MENLKVLKTTINSSLDKEKSTKLTGYPSIDKPWLKYYTEEEKAAEIPEMTCYQVLYDYNKNCGAAEVLDYFGRKITYSELFANIDKAARAYVNLGVKAGDIVTICGVSTPELIYSFYALNKIGAVPNVIDPRTNAKGINRYLKEVDSKLLVTLDLCYPNVKNAIEGTSVENVVVFSANDSLPFGLKVAKVASDKLKEILRKEQKLDIPNSAPYIRWDDFIKAGSEIKTIPIKPYTKDYPAGIVHTGGTTGVPKAVVLSNENFNAAMIQVKNCPADVERGDVFLNVIVPFVAFGTVLALHTPTVLGWKTVLVPKFEVEKIDDLVIKNKPNVMMGVPTYFETLMKSPKMVEHDLSHFNAILGGGDKTLEEFEHTLNDFLRDHGSKAVYMKGYSLTECSSVATCSFRNINAPGSNGIPLSKTTISAFEPGTDEELPYNTSGELCINTPTIMVGYLNNEEATEEVKQMHSDGKYWVHTGDIGYVDEDGMIYTVDRIKRMIPRSGYKVFPSELENLFVKHPAVETCAVVGIYDPVDKEVPKAHIVLKPGYLADYEKLKQELNEMIAEAGFPEYFTPVDYKFRSDIPVTDIGKIDFMALKAEDDAKIEPKIKVYVK